jgi:hypothetical protein
MRNVVEVIGDRAVDAPDSHSTFQGGNVRINHRFTMLAIATTMVAGFVSAGAAGAASAAPAPAQTNTIVSGSAPLSPDVARTVNGAGADARQRALAQYWSSARMKAAKSDTDLPAVKARASAPRTTNATTAPTKPEGPAGQVAPIAPQTAPKASTGSGVEPLSYYPNYPVGHPVARTYGKVFFTSFGVNYVCSATVVNSEGRSEVWTAGHCVSDGQAWNYTWVFVPNYVNGAAPYGVWYANQLWTTSAWFYNNNNFANDVGAAVMWRNNGRRIADYLGGQGIAWNFPIGYYMYAFGYPQAYPFNGQYLVGDNGVTYNGGGGTIYMVNYMTGGSSGGGWLNWFNGQWGYINGHNDFKFSSYPQYMFSPYYGNQVASLYNTVRGIST